MKNRRINDTNGPSSASQRAKHKEIGNYMLSKTMGEGTFGEVKLAIHKPTLERVAAKVKHQRGGSGDLEGRTARVPPPLRFFHELCVCI